MSSKPAAKPAFTVKGADPSKDTAPAPARMASTSGQKVVTLGQMDIGKFRLGTELKSGTNGDKYVELFYDDARFTYDVCKLPEYARCPFKAGPARSKETGKELGNAWSIAVEVTNEQVANWNEFETWLIENCKKFMHEAFPPKNAKAPPITEPEFARKFNSLVRGADVDKGYAATIRMAVQHEPVDANGNPRTMPKIFKAHLKENPTTGRKGITKPIAGTINDLDRGSAIVPVAALSRGIYFGGTGWGIKMPLSTAYVLTNCATSNGPSVDTSGVEIFDEETPDDDHLAKRQRNDEPFSGGGGFGGQFDDCGLGEAQALLTSSA